MEQVHRRVARGLTAGWLFMVFAGSSGAQVVAKQGAPRFDPAKIFRSPMILEFEAPRLQTVAPQNTWRVTEIGEYRCEDVWISYLNVRRADRGKKAERRFEISGSVFVAESFDRFVTIRLEVLDGEKVIGAVTKNKLDAEERKVTAFEVNLDLDAAKVAALAAAVAPKLRLTMTLAKDGSNNWIPPDQTQ